MPIIYVERRTHVNPEGTSFELGLGCSHIYQRWRQDGRIEGLELTPLSKTIKITTSEQPLTKKTRTHEKSSKDKEGATMRQCEGHFCSLIKSCTQQVGNLQTRK